MNSTAAWGVPLVEVRRGGYVESQHTVACCASDAQGRVIASLGDIDQPIFVRSALKPLIAVAVATVAKQAGFALESDELAIIAASHYGEPQHVAVVEKLLARAGCNETDLQCGAARPRDSASVREMRAVYNNCSGKHAGLLLLCNLLGVPRKNYVTANHPVNRAWIAVASRIYDADVAAAPQGVDGCGLPVFALPLRTQARGYARIAAPDGLVDADADAVLLVRAAMMQHPRLVGGTAHLDTRLMTAGQGTLVAKIGAEALHCSAVLPSGLGLAVKIVDGSERARPPAVIKLLDRLGALDAGAQERLADLASPTIRNVAGLPVGDLRVLEEALPTPTFP